MLKAHCLNTATPQSSRSSLIAARPVGPGVVLEPVRSLEVAAVVVPAGGVAPAPPRVVPPPARPVCVPILVLECEGVVALAPPTILVVEALVLEVAVEPVVVVVVERLSVVAAAATVRLLPAKKATKESAADKMLRFSFSIGAHFFGRYIPGSRLILARSLPPSPSIASAALACGQEKPLLSVNVLSSSA